jgi:hypothetical protein
VAQGKAQLAWRQDRPINNAMTRAGGNDRKSGKSGGGGRGERLAAALRENLRRRKAQERGRGAQNTPEPRAKPGLAPRDDQTR